MKQSHAGRRALASLLIAAILCSSPILRGQAIPNEYRLKAAFLYQFPQFVDWPAPALQGAASLQLCVASPNPFGAELAELVRGESLGGRPLAVREIEGVDGLPGCHLLFVGARHRTRAALLKSAAAKPVLTVGETEGFLDGGGIILLTIVERRVRFEVSTENARKAGLKISSQLLNLASAVHGGVS